MRTKRKDHSGRHWHCIQKLEKHGEATCSRTPPALGLGTTDITRQADGNRVTQDPYEPQRRPNQSLTLPVLGLDTTDRELCAEQSDGPDLQDREREGAVPPTFPSQARLHSARQGQRGEGHLRDSSRATQADVGGRIATRTTTTWRETHHEPRSSQQLGAPSPTVPSQDGVNQFRGRTPQIEGSDPERGLGRLS